MDLIDRALAGLSLDDVFIVDCHAHGGGRKAIDRDDSVERYVQRMDRVGIDVTCLSAFPPSAGATLQRHNDLVAQFTTAQPERFRGYCWVTPNYPEHVLGELARCIDELHFVGIKVHTHPQYPYDGPRYDAVYRFADEHHLPILAHTWGDVSVRQFAAMARKHPNARFLLGHTSAGDININIEELDRTPNLYAELAFSGGTPRQTELLVRRIGAPRILWGSDTPLFAASHQIGKVVFADISDIDKRLILGENARRLFNLA